MSRKSQAAGRKKVKLPPEAFDRIPRVQVTFTDETVWVTRFDARGRATATYPVALADVASAFDAIGLSTGLLAEHTLFHQNVHGTPRIGVWLPPSKRTLTFSGRKPESFAVPLPGLVFVGQGVRYWVYAASERPAALAARLYHTPLPNVYASGVICPGNVKFPKASPATITLAVAAFFESDFTGDLGQGIVRAQAMAGALEEDEDPYEVAHRGGQAPERRARGAEAPTLRAFLRSLKSAKQFPLDELTPSVTMQQLLSDKES